ncbi:hypothetical protein ACOSP7_017826 [Xanthoceras sorbifolium]
MAQIKFITGLFSLLMFTALFSIVRAQQDGDADAVVAIVSKGKGVLDEGTATVATKQIVGGRKLSPIFKVRKPEKFKESSAAISTTATHKFAGKCAGKDMSNASYCKTSVNHHFSQDVDDKGFVAFNADYHAPRHHPPKNN